MSGFSPVAASPLWLAVGVAPVVFAAAYLLTRACIWLLTARPLRKFRRASDVHWTEAAKLALRVRVVFTWYAMPLPFLFGVTARMLAMYRLGLPNGPWALLAGIGSLLAVVGQGQRLECALCEATAPVSPGRRGIAVIWVMILPGLVTFGLVLDVMPAHWGAGAIAALTGGFALMTAMLAGAWIPVVQRFGALHPVSPRLEAIVAGGAARTGVCPRRVFELDSPNANALALPVSRQLVFTRPLLAILDDDALASVAAHELGHLSEPRTMLWTRIVVAFLPVVALAGIPLGGSYGIVAGAAPFGTLVLGVIFLKKKARRMEERSDRLGREHEREAGTYARALEAVYRFNRMPAVMPGKNQVHPHLYDRLVAAGLNPDYARPLPPPSSRLTRAAVFVLLVLGFGVGFHYASERPTPRRADAERFFLRGNDCVARDDFEGAAEFYAMAADRDPNQWAYWTLTCNALTELGRYDDAEAALRRAESAFRRAGTFDVMRSPVNHMRASIRRRRTGGTPRKTLPDEPLFGREW